MTLSHRQKHITNPYPEKYTDPNDPGRANSAIIGGANGLNYDYHDERNKWVLDGIQDCFINYGYFPRIGKKLKSLGPLTEQNNVVQLKDLMAYAALYPQNGTVRQGLMFVTDFESAEPPLGLTPITVDESIVKLNQVCSFILEEGQVAKFFSSSTPEIQEPENYLLFQQLSSLSYEEINEGLLAPYQDNLYSALIAVESPTNHTRLRQIRKSFDNDPELLVTQPSGESESQTQFFLKKQTTGLDFNEWSLNVSPDRQRKVAYYNPVDRKLYFCVRTRNRDPEAYDKGLLSINDSQVQNVDSFRREALRSMAKFANRFVSESDQQLIEDNLPLVEFECRYGDSFRPPAPSGFGVWLLGASIPVSVIGLFPEVLTDNDEQEVPIKITPSSLEISRNLIANLIPDKTFSYPLENIQNNISQTLRVLNTYNNKLFDDGVSREILVKLNLESEILKLEEFSFSLHEMAASVDVSLSPQDYIDIKVDKDLQICFVIFNGSAYFQNLGKDINTLLPAKNKGSIEIIADPSGDIQIETKDRSSLESYENFFQEYSPTTINYILNSKKISKFSSKLESNDLPSWSEFFIEYTYPNPNENSIDPNKVTKQEIIDPKTRLVRTVTPEEKKSILAGTLPRSHDTQIFKDRMQRDRVLAQRAKTRAELYYLAKNSIASCDTGLARILQSGLKAYELYDKKARPKDWVTLAVNTVRNDIIDLLVATNRLDQEDASEAKRGIDKGVSYTRDPDRIRREIEKYVNDQISGCLDVIGEAVFDFVIDPESKPKTPKKYWRNKINPPKKLKLQKGFTRNFLGPWGKSLKQLTIKFAEQLILSVLKDIISSALGCGPTLRNDSRTKDKSANSRFGVVRINEVADNSDINLLDVASKFSIENTAVIRDENEEVVNTVTPARLEQLRQLNEDVSDFLTQEECIALLDGNSNSRIVAALNEMINRGSYTIPASISIDESLRTNEQYMAQFQNSLRKNDVIYATLGLNEDTIKKYFAEIGDRTVDIDDLLDDLDPKEAFCAKNSLGQEGLLDLGISQAQFSTQVDNEIDRKVQKIKDWCDFSFDGGTLAAQISDFFANFPVAAAYNNLLAGISQASNAAQKALLEALSAEQRSTRVPQTQELEYTDTDFYIFCEDIYGDTRLDPSVFLGGAGVPRWSLGNRTALGEISFLFNNESAFWFSRQEEDQFDINFFNNPLAQRNSPLEIENIPKYSLAGLSNLSGQQAIDVDNESFNFTSGAASSTNSTLSLIESQIRNNRDLAVQTQGYSEFSLLMKNTSGDVGLIREQLANFWITDTAVRRIPKVTEVLGSQVFDSISSKCETTKSKNIAEAAFNGIRTRALNFVLNVGALFRIFPGYLTPDILNSLSHYLASKTMIQWREKNIFNVYAESMSDLQNHYQDSGNEENILFDIEPEPTIESKLAKVYYLILQTYFTRFGNGNVYSFIGTNIFNPEDSWQTEDSPLSKRSILIDYKSLVDTLKDGEYNFVSPGGRETQDIPLNYGENVEKLQETLPGLAGIDNATWEENALYYLPVPQIIALQLIYYDKIIDVNGRWPQFRFNTGLREARADDALLSAVNETYISIFSNPYEGFPVVIEGERYYSREEIIERIVELQNARDRIYELEILFGPLVRKEDDYFNRAYYDEGEESYLTKSGMSNSAIAVFRDFFNVIYSRVSALYLDKYKTVGEKETLYRDMMNYAFTANFANNFDPGGVEGEEGWIRQRAWYERGRMLGYAPSADGSLLGQWFDGDSDEQSTFTNLDGTTRELTDDEKETYKKVRSAFFNLNIWKNADGSDARSSWLEWTSFLTDAGRWLSQGLAAADPDDDIEFFGSENWFFFRSLGAVAGGPAYLVGATFELIFNSEPSWAQPGQRNWFARVMPWGWLEMLGELDKYLDPDEDDSLKFLRNPDPPSDLANTAVVFLDAQKSIMNAAQQLDNHRGSATSLGTLDKAAISFLYYELAWKSQSYKSRIDTDNPSSELSQLLQYINYEDTRDLEAGFPVYLEMDHLAKIYTTENASGTQASIRTFLTIQQLKNYERQLQTHPVMRNRNTWAAASNRVITLFNECVNAVVEAEEFLRSQPEREDEDNRFDRIRYKLYGIRDDIAGPTPGQQIAWAAWDVRGTSGAIDVLTFIEETSYQDVLSEDGAQANYRAYATELKAELANMVRDGGMLSEGVGSGYQYIRDRGVLIIENFDEILQLNNELHQIYFSITNGTNPQVLAGLDYDKHSLIMDAATPPNRFSMNDWVTAFEEDIGKIQNAISWRE